MAKKSENTSGKLITVSVVGLSGKFRTLQYNYYLKDGISHFIIN